ncbi:MAG: aminotransferase class I/II-fold pyridoxal phosphate-dependent enzyme [Eubacteriales bacterium]|nr:aminotransferase class I/II-fold pyridoxal phosphate-dependent enzyme [Eubacteriales bacterium]
MSKREFAPDTKIIHGEKHGMNPYGSLQMPIFQTSTFEFENTAQGAARFAGKEGGYIYSRLGSPTTTQVEEKVAYLEDAEAACAFSSGMGAISSSTTTFLKAGDRMVADKALYGCTFALFSHKLSQFGIDVEFVDFRDLAAVKKALEKKTDMIYFETIANPTMKVVDIEAAAKLAHDANKDCIVVVDNTFATGLICKPLNLGADIVVHSATKYLNGHGDVIAGFAASSNKYMATIKGVGLKDLTGSVLGSQEAFLVNRGLKTLTIRMQKHCENALKIAQALEKDSRIKNIYYPGLASHVDADVIKKQLKNFGGMIAFDTETPEIAEKMMNNVQLCTLAVSLGDAETLIQHPGSMTHSTYSDAEMEAAGFSKCLVRLSVGLEDPDDIIWDVLQALDIATK